MTALTKLIIYTKPHRMSSTRFLKILSFALLLFCAEAQACDCKMPDFQAAYDSASHIFIGKVTEMTTNWMSGGMKATFVVSKNWKSPTEQLMVVNTPFERNCGYTFEVGKEYLVFANKKFTYKTNACTRNILLENAEKDIELLGKSGKIGTGKAKYYIWGMGISTVLGILVLLYVVLRKRKKR